MKNLRYRIFTAAVFAVMFFAHSLSLAFPEKRESESLFPDAPERIARYIDYLDRNPEVASAIKWFVGEGAAPPGEWDIPTRRKFYSALESVEAGKIAPFDKPPVPISFPPTSRNGYTPKHPFSYMLEELSCIQTGDAVDIYFHHIAYSLKLEIDNVFHWRLADMDSVELDLLLAPRNFYYLSTKKFHCAPFQLNWNPETAASFLQENGVAGNTPAEIIYALTKLFREKLLHYYYREGERFPDVMERMYGFRRIPTLDEFLSGVDDGGENKSFSIGCPGTSWLYREILRAANIPVRIGFSSFEGLKHHRAEFPTAGIGLPHSDDVYDSRLLYSPEIPVEEIFYTPDELRKLIDNPQCPDDEKDCPGLGFLSSCNAEKKMLDLVIKHSGSWFLRIRARMNPDEGGFPEYLDSALTGIQRDMKVVVPGKPFYSAEERERIIKDVDSKIISLGHGDWGAGVTMAIIAPSNVSLRDFYYKRYYPDSSILAEEGQVRNGSRAGEWKTSAPDGRLMKVTDYHGFSMDVTLWNLEYENGAPMQNWEYNSGLGMATVYHENGNRKISCEFKGEQDNELQDSNDENDPKRTTFRQFMYHGSYTTWNENGSKKKECNYADGLKNGECVEWSNDGRRILESNYRGGRLHGKSTAWFVSGNKKYEKEYFDGLPHGVYSHWYENGKLNELREYNRGALDGKFEAYLENGTLVLSTSYSSGLESGTHTEWNEKGNKILEAQYKSGDLDGLSTEWYSSGAIKSKVEYRAGKKHGFSTIYDMHGKIVIDRLYKNGEFLQDNF